MRAILIAAAVGAGAAAAATAAMFGYRRRHAERKALKSEVGKWEGEGGNVPQVPTPAPAPVPDSSVPAGRDANAPG